MPWPLLQQILILLYYLLFLPSLQLQLLQIFLSAPTPQLLYIPGLLTETLA
jgi:hypothetical protein